MDKLLVKGPTQLHGRVRMSGAKNAALPILASTLLAEGTNILRNVPQLKDVDTILELLHTLGCAVSKEPERLLVSTDNVSDFTAPYNLVKQMRASILTLGPLLARHKRAKVSLPGGCAIGARPINFHLHGFSKMNAAIHIAQGYVEATTTGLKGADITVDFPSVTATENLLMAATLADGETIIRNAAKEPEIVDLIGFLRQMGGLIEGEGTDTLFIEGVTQLKGTEYEIIPDRIETGTYLVAAAIVGGDVIVERCVPNHLTVILGKLQEIGIPLTLGKDFIHILPNNRLHPLPIQTLPYPGFPTDMQAQFVALLTQAEGVSTITETIFENRFNYVPELVRMGAKIAINERTATVTGSTPLSGTQVMATDLRASASLIIAALRAEGVTEISRVYHLDRGYEHLDKKLASLGATIERI